MLACNLKTNYLGNYLIDMNRSVLKGNFLVILLWDPPPIVGKHGPANEAMPKATGTDRSDIVGAKLGVDYHKVNLANGVVIEKLDDWFCGLAKWCLSPDCVFDNPEQYEICMASRSKLCEGFCATRSLSVDTLKAYCNCIARAVKQSGGHLLW